MYSAISYILAVAICIALLVYGIVTMPGNYSFSTILGLGIGTITPQTMIRYKSFPTAGATSLIANVLIANVGQLVLSVLYFGYNALFTCMAQAIEWSDFAFRRKGLRVSSSPKGYRRSTYFLQLPYRYAVPLIALSGVLHWLVSQSIFLIDVELYVQP